MIERIALIQDVASLKALLSVQYGFSLYALTTGEMDFSARFQL
jgi:hypothetical protein